MQLMSVNVGTIETIHHKNKSFATGIRKYPAPGSVFLDEPGVRGDAIGDSEHHGGSDQAVYAYSADDYDWWAAQSSRKFPPGLFGENLTIRGLSSDLNVGDRLLIGGVVLEATAPRIPCSTLAARMGNSGFGLEFRNAERPGIYFRVLNSGDVAAGDTVTFVPDDSSRVSIIELFRFNYALQYDAHDMRRYLSAPLAARFRDKIERRLAAAEGQTS